MNFDVEEIKNGTNIKIIKNVRHSKIGPQIKNMITMISIK